MTISRRKFMRNFLTMAGLGSLLGFLDAFWFERSFIQIKKIDLNPQKDQKPILSVLQISDLHLQNVGSALKSLAEKITQLNPDLICITGDSIDKAENLEKLNDFLKLLPKQTPKTAILGNWEYWANIDITRLRSIYQAHHCDLLINQSTQLNIKGKTIAITGVDDLLGGKADYLESEKQYLPSDYHIVLNHCPAYRDAIQKLHQQKIDVILAGHTHGGQINLLGYIPFLPKGSGKYIKGWYKDSLPIMYVSKGIGTSIIPFRLGSRAEVAIFNIF
jgi:uncharacterized protein